MKKIIPIMLMILIASALAGAVSIGERDSIYDDPSFEALNPVETFFSLFTIATTATTSIDVGESTLIAVDERANKECDNAMLALDITQPNGVVEGKYFQRGVNVQIGTRLAETFRWYPTQEGTHLFEGMILCANTAEEISKTSTLTVQVGKTSTCTEEFVSKSFCDDVGNRVLKRFRNCPGDIVTNKEVQDCTDSGLSCYQGACITLQEEQKVCNPGDTIRSYCQNDNTIRSEVCSSSGLDVNLKDATCEGDLVCFGAECVKQDKVDPGGDGEGVCCTNLDKSVKKEYPDRDKCPALWSPADDCASTPGPGDGDGTTDLVPSILEEKLNSATETELEDSSCERSVQCDRDGRCIPFDRLPSIIQDRLSKGIFNIAEEGVCVIPLEEGSDFDDGTSLCPRQFAFIGITNDECTDGWIMIGLFILGFLILVNLIQKGGK